MFFPFSLSSVSPYSEAGGPPRFNGYTASRQFPHRDRRSIRLTIPRLFRLPRLDWFCYRGYLLAIKVYYIIHILFFHQSYPATTIIIPSSSQISVLNSLPPKPGTFDPDPIRIMHSINKKMITRFPFNNLDFTFHFALHVRY